MYLGSIFQVHLGGYLFKVSFDCDETLEEETGIVIAVVTNIRVTDKVGGDVNQWVDMEEVEKICLEKAIEALNLGSPPNVFE